MASAFAAALVSLIARIGLRTTGPVGFILTLIFERLFIYVENKIRMHFKENEYKNAVESNDNDKINNVTSDILNGVSDSKKT